MTAPLTRPEPVRWLAPAPLWSKVPAPGVLEQPWIAEMPTDLFPKPLLDAFFDVFQAILGGTSGRSPADLAGTSPVIDGGGVRRLYQANDHRYNLIVASLVCQRVGIPDHTVLTRKGERAAFVVRRIASSGVETAHVPGGPWVPATPGALLPGEQSYPMFPLPVAPFAAPGSVAATLGMASGQRSTRTVQYGYIPVTAVGEIGGFGEPMQIRAVLLRDPCPAVLGAPSPLFSIELPRTLFPVDSTGDIAAKEATP